MCVRSPSPQHVPRNKLMLGFSVNAAPWAASGVWTDGGWWELMGQVGPGWVDGGRFLLPRSGCGREWGGGAECWAVGRGSQPAGCGLERKALPFILLWVLPVWEPSSNKISSRALTYTVAETAGPSAPAQCHCQGLPVSHRREKPHHLPSENFSFKDCKDRQEQEAPATPSPLSY